MEQVLMRPLLVFGLAFGGGTALCQYLLPAAVRPWWPTWVPPQRSICLHQHPTALCTWAVIYRPEYL